jgi:hypothetical protein
LRKSLDFACQRSRSDGLSRTAHLGAGFGQCASNRRRYRLRCSGLGAASRTALGGCRCIWGTHVVRHRYPLGKIDGIGFVVCGRDLCFTCGRHFGHNDRCPPVQSSPAASSARSESQDRKAGSPMEFGTELPLSILAVEILRTTTKRDLSSRE